ncbi:hypothetical protein [Mycobacterium sp.]|uniref:hypothetical protein n=1 Tax=Mycobacterium sp. TaxID=1785 RepID=UPI0031D8FF15
MDNSFDCIRLGHTNEPIENNTQKWLLDEVNRMNIMPYNIALTNAIELKNVTTKQMEYTMGGVWHIRDGIFYPEIGKIEYSMNKTIVYGKTIKRNETNKIPKDYDYLLYYYHVKDAKPTGSIIFFKDDKPLSSLEHYVIGTENLNIEGIGLFPNIDFKVYKKDISNIVLTNSYCIIQGI